MTLSHAKIMRRRHWVRPSVSLSRQGDLWVAHCADLDLVTSGPDRNTVKEDMVRVCLAKVKFAIDNDLTGNLFRTPTTRRDLGKPAKGSAGKPAGRTDPPYFTK